MIDFKWAGGVEPKYKTEDKVFVINTICGRCKISETYVRNVPLEYWFVEGEHWLKFLGHYDLSLLTFPGDFMSPSWCDKKYIFATKEEAEAGAKFWSVDRSLEDWLIAIGDRKIEIGTGNIEDGCDLQSCCANISAIRDALEEVKKHKGICEVDRLELQELLNSHECPTNIDGSVLSEILSSMNLVWNSQEQKDVVE